MRKRWVSLLLVMIMLLSALLTSCASKDDETVDLTTYRLPTYLTVYAITGDTTTPEAIQAVQAKLNTFTTKFKTSLVLRFYTKDKYQEAIEAMWKQFEADKSKKLADDEADKIAKKEQQEYEKTLNKDELRKLRQQQRLDKRAADKAAAEADQERIKAILNGEEGAPEPITSAQMDIVYIDGYDSYVSLIAGNPDYNGGSALLQPLDEKLKRDEKLITDYVNPVILAAADLGAGKSAAATYAIPVNKSVASQGKYFLFNKALVEKYNMDVSNVKSLYNCEDFLATIKTNEPNVVPMVKPVELMGLDFYDDVYGGAISVTNSEYGPFPSLEASSTFKTYSVKSHFERMWTFRQNGYFAADPNNAPNFFLDIRTGSLSDVAKWESEGYIVRTYITPTVTAKNCLTGLYGISAYSKLFDRSAEILTLLYCNADFKTVFTYGVENVNWIKNDDGTISKINDDYSMDFYQTGNTLIGYHTSDIPADYRDSAIQSNLIMKPDGFITFAGTFDEEQQDIIKQANEIVAGKYEELCQGVEDWEAQNNDILAKLDAIGFPDFLTNVFNAQYGPVATALSESEAARKAQKPPYLDDSANNGKTETGESNTEEVNTEEANTGEVEE